MSVKDLLAEACAHLAGLTSLTRDEMRLAGYPDSKHQIDVCQRPMATRQHFRRGCNGTSGSLLCQSMMRKFGYMADQADD